jgi:hypothetical protein
LKSRIFAAVGVLLIVAGVLGLVYGGFTYTQDSKKADLGFMELKLKEQERLEVPIWASITSVAAGTVLLLIGRKKN